jgi:hypothetical protein
VAGVAGVWTLGLFAHFPKYGIVSVEHALAAKLVITRYLQVIARHGLPTRGRSLLWNILDLIIQEMSQLPHRIVNFVIADFEYASLPRLPPRLPTSGRFTYRVDIRAVAL